tara:strand:+ start:9151 stop:9495 length:345 start_codon:yes stop_codon:yes gene_type:complete
MTKEKGRMNLTHPTSSIIFSLLAGIRLPLAWTERPKTSKAVFFTSPRILPNSLSLPQVFISCSHLSGCLRLVVNSKQSASKGLETTSTAEERDSKVVYYNAMNERRLMLICNAE